MFATFSDDGSTKLWDVAKLEGRNIVNKARLSYSQQGVWCVGVWVCVVGGCVCCVVCVPKLYDYKEYMC